MFQVSDFWYLGQQDQPTKSASTVMSEQFHQQLNQLALDVKNNTLTSREKRRIKGEICRIIASSQELKQYKRKLFRDYSLRDSNVTPSVFEACYPDALQDTSIFILEKIENYNPGKGYIVGLDWQAFERDLQKSPESLSTLAEDFKEKIDCYRQTIDKSLKRKRDYQPEKSEELKSICSNFANSIDKAVTTSSHSSEKIETLWHNFSEQVTIYDNSKDLFDWFKFILRYRFIDRKNELLNYKFKRVKTLDTETGKKKYTRTLITSKFLDAQINRDNSKPMVEQIASKPQIDRTLQDLIAEDPDNIFTAKHLRNHPEVNFREIQLLHSQDYSCERILAHFKNQVVLGNISSQYHRSLKYFYPILEEYREARLPLTESAVDIIRQDLEIRTGEKGRKKPSEIRMKEKADINFQNIIIQRKDSFYSWTLLAKHLDISSRDLILFYLDNLQKSKLYQTIKERQKQQ